MPQWLYLLYYLITYTVTSRQYLKILGEADDTTEKEEERHYIFRNMCRLANETIYDSFSTQHLDFKH